ncbi:MAG: hypothetical protein FWD85_06990 [Microbacteriaceae bacterium]|nr:hypothetical protein [Microbacteriaceae bacterium]
MPGRWAKYLLGLVSIGTVIAVIPVLGIVFGAEQSMMRGAEYASSVAAAQPGIVDNGRTVYNIYAYDADGNPLTNVQLYDQDGNPLVAAPDESTDTVPGVNHYGEAFTAMPNPLASGALGWAVYPLPTKAAPQSPPFPAAPRLNAATTGSPSADDGASDASGQPTPTPTALRTPGKDAAAPTPTPTPAG